MRIKLQYYHSLYLSGGITPKKLGKIKRKLARHPMLADVYLISPAGNGTDQLDIYHSGQLRQNAFLSRPPLIIGIALSYDEAVGLVERMARLCYESRGDCEIKEYLLC